MPTTIHPLTGVQYSDNGFSLEPAVPDDLGEAMYDLRRLLRGEHRFESEISEEIRKTVPELRARGQFVPWQYAIACRILSIFSLSSDLEALKTRRL